MATKAKAETKMKNKMGGSDIQICPVCGGHNVNKTDSKTYYCTDCFIEIDRKGKPYSIMYDGTLVDYHVNEFVDCG